MSDADLSYVNPYYRNPRTEILPYVPEGVERLLDIGCGVGAFGSSVKAARKCEVWGIELVPHVAQLAESKLDRVFAGDVVQRVPELPDASFDVVTCLDVLEHLAWPDQLLRSLTRVLKPGGRVVASLPNIRYWPNLRELVQNGNFSYVDSGILDRTHLRFYTRNSIPELFAAAKYRVVSIEGLFPYSARTLKIANLLGRGRFSDCAYLQYAVVAEPESQ